VTRNFEKHSFLALLLLLFDQMAKIHQGKKGGGGGMLKQFEL